MGIGCGFQAVEVSVAIGFSGHKIVIICVKVGFYRGNENG